jgi:beta-lactamase regulating signal transducer with metallopeptidase domain
MKMLIRFSPFLLFVVLGRFVDWRLGVAAGLVASIFVIVASRPRRIGVVSGAMLGFFVAASILALVAPNTGVHPYLHAVSAGWFALVAGVSILVGHPFTLDFSKDAVSPEVAASPRFVAVNRAISAMWAFGFAVIAAALAVATAGGREILGTAVTVVVVMVLMKRSTSRMDGTPSDRHTPIGGPV